MSVHTDDKASKELDVTEEPGKSGEPRVDEVFGAQSTGGPNYTNVGWAGSAVLMTKSQIGLGVLSIPSVLQTLGAVPGVLSILAVAIITTWSDYEIGVFKRRHKTVHSVADVGFLLGGPFGREVFGLMYWLYMTMIAGSGLLSISIALNAVSSHATCTVVWVVIGAVVVFSLSSIQTLGRVSWLGWIGLVSIMAAIITLAAAVGVSRPALAPPTGPWDKELHAFASPTFAEASNALGTVVFAFGGCPSFFSIVAEMRDPRQFTKAVIACQSFVAATYIIIGIVVYYYAGQYVSSPALGTAGPLLKKICYGIAIPSLIVAATLYSHLPAKYIFVRLLRGSRHLGSNTLMHWVIWLSCVGGCVSFSFVIAMAIPVFNGLIGLIGALFGTFLSMQIYGAMWLYDNWARRSEDKSLGFRLMVAWTSFVILAGSFLMVGGTYGSIVGIIAAGSTTQPFSCADNSL